MTMWDYEFIKQTVIMTAFVFIIMLDVWGIGYWIVKLVKWIWRKLHKANVQPEDKTAAE